MDIFKLKVITPTKIFYEGDVTMVELCTTYGEIGVYAKHIPMTAVIAPGLLRIHTAEGEMRLAALISGFCEILEDSMTIMAEACEWPDEIDEERAKEAEARARERLGSLSSEIDIARAELALRRALVRIDAKNKQ